MTTTQRTKIHTVYKNAEGKRLPSVTTVLGILAKPALIDWAWKCGKDGLDYKSVRDDAGNVGTLAHYLILCHLRNEKPDLSEWPKDQIDRAENSFLKYLEWAKGHKVVPLLTEQPLVSDVMGFSGTIDCLAELDGVLVLIDHKSGKAIYSDMVYQLGAYWHLLQQAGRAVDHARILRIGRDETETFEEKYYSLAELARGYDVFQHCLAVYRLTGRDK